MFSTNFGLGGREFVVMFFNEILVDATKWRSSVRYVAILFPKPSQFRKFSVEVGLAPQVCVIIEENS